MINLEPITEDTLYIAKEIANSNEVYNKLENGNTNRTDEEIRKEFIGTESEHFFIKADDTYIGILSYLHINPKDQTPWIGLFMIHGDYQGFGYGMAAYNHIEQHLLSQGKNKIRLGVLEKNDGAKRFWENNGYSFYKISSLNNNTVYCYEKNI